MERIHRISALSNSVASKSVLVYCTTRAWRGLRLHFSKNLRTCAVTLSNILSLLNLWQSIMLFRFAVVLPANTQVSWVGVLVSSARVLSSGQGSTSSGQSSLWNFKNGGVLVSSARVLSSGRGSTSSGQSSLWNFKNGGPCHQSVLSSNF